MGEEYLEMAELEGGRVTIAVEDRVEGRLHYRLADTWSPWGSSDSPVGSLVIIILPIMFCVEYLFIYNIVKLRQGSGKNRQRMVNKRPLVAPKRPKN